MVRKLVQFLTEHFWLVFYTYEFICPQNWQRIEIFVCFAKSRESFVPSAIVTFYSINVAAAVITPTRACTYIGGCFVFPRRITAINNKKNNNNTCNSSFLNVCTVMQKTLIFRKSFLMINANFGQKGGELVKKSRISHCMMRVINFRNRKFYSSAS